MDKRDFLAAGMVGAITSAVPLPAAAQHAPPGGKGPTLLTVTGLIGAGNRGAFDPALDQMMGKQKITFAKAHCFDFATLASMPATTIKPMLEYDGKVHALKGP